MIELDFLFLKVELDLSIEIDMFCKIHSSFFDISVFFIELVKILSLFLMYLM